MSCEFCGSEMHAAQRCPTEYGERARAERRVERIGPTWLYGSDDDSTRQVLLRLCLRYVLVFGMVGFALVALWGFFLEGQ